MSLSKRLEGWAVLIWIFVSTWSPPKSPKSAVAIFFVQSIKFWTFSSNTFLSPKASKAPALIRFSRDFLLIILAHLLRKSSREVNFPPFCLSCWIVSHTSSPIPFVEKNQSLMTSQIAATWLNDSLTSGPSTEIPLFWISEI